MTPRVWRVVPYERPFWADQRWVCTHDATMRKAYYGTAHELLCGRRHRSVRTATRHAQERTAREQP